MTWPDRRPILTLSLADTGYITPANPHGMHPTLRDARTLKQGVSAVVATAGGVSKAVGGAQGVIVWNIELCRRYDPLGFAGNPPLLYLLAPEMDKAADPLFAGLRAQGLAVGVTIRHTAIVRDASGAWLHVEPWSPAGELIAKIRYAQKRWGCTLFYVDSNGDWLNTRALDVRHFDAVRRACPDVLLIPEHEGPGYVESGLLPYRDVREGPVPAAPWALALNFGDAPDSGPTPAQVVEIREAMRAGTIPVVRGYWSGASEIGFVARRGWE